MQPIQIQPHGWCFPDNSIDPTSDIQFIQFHTVKPIWAEVDTGLIVLRDNSSYGSNFYYNAVNALICTQYSKEQYINVSCDTGTDMDALCSDSGNRATSIATLMSFLSTTGFNGGVELDFEGFGSWTSGQYTNFKTFCDELRAALNAVGLKLMVDLPPIWNDSGTVDPTSPYEWRQRNSSGYYVLSYEDMDGHADYLVPMAYDYQYDIGAGAPNQPLEWLADIIAWSQLKIYTHSKIVMGLPGAGYSGATGGFTIAGHDFNFLSGQTGFSQVGYDITGAPTDSGELIWANGGISYAAIDDQSMMLKINRCLAMGITAYSIWYIGSNRYGNPQGKSSTLTQGRPVPQYAAPSTGDTVNVNLTTTALIVNPSGTLANLILAIVDGIYDGQGMDIVFTQNIAALTITGSSFISGFPPSLSAGTMFRMVWSAIVGSWCVN